MVATTNDLDRDAAETWFLHRGLPAVLTSRARGRYLWPRSAPALAAYATVVFFLIGTSEVYIDGAPTRVERIVLAVIALAFPLAALAGWRVSRLRRRRTQSLVSTAAVAVAAMATVIQGGISHLLGTIVIVVVVTVCTASGAGAVLSWAVRLTLTQVAAMGALFVRALPVVLLTVVVFFNTYVWVLAATISQVRLWFALSFLLAVTAAFIVSGTVSRVRPMLEAASAPPHDAHQLTGAPFAAIPDLPVAQLAHLLMVAISTAAIYFVLGLIVLSPALLAKWTGNGPSDGTVLGMTIPVPQSLMNMALVLCALTFMYVSARSVGDDEYNSRFLAPLIEDLHDTLIARNRYCGERQKRTDRKAVPSRVSRNETLP